MSATEMCLWGWTVHFFADWFLQNEWMALNKVSLKHPAAWVHGGIHFGVLLFVFPFWPALLLAIAHVLIDTRIPLQHWRRLIHQTQQGPIMVPFALWQDQASHLILLAVAAKLVESS